MIDIIEKIGIGTANEGERMEIVDTKGESFTDVVEEQPFLIILGKDSVVFRDKQQELFLKLATKRKDNKDFIETVEESNKRTIELLASCVIDIGNVGKDAANLEYNEENVKYLLRNSPALTDQVDAFIVNRTNFLKKQ